MDNSVEKGIVDIIQQSIDMLGDNNPGKEASQEERIRFLNYCHGLSHLMKGMIKKGWNFDKDLMKRLKDKQL